MFFFFCPLRRSKTVADDQEDDRESPTHLLSSDLAAALSVTGAGEASQDITHMNLSRSDDEDDDDDDDNEDDDFPTPPSRPLKAGVFKPPFTDASGLNFAGPSLCLEEMESR